MSGKHVKQVAWRPRRLAPALTLLAGVGTWAALAAALVLLPSTTPADVHGALDGPAHEQGERDDPPAVPPQTLRTRPSKPDATPSAHATVVSRDARRTAQPEASTTSAADPATSGPTSDPTSTTHPGPVHPSPPGQANGHDDDNPGRGHGPHGKP